MQETLSKQSPLDDENLRVAVTLLEMFAKLESVISDAERSQIQAPDIDGRMRSIADLTTGNSETRDKYIMLSPHVPLHTARRLHIPSEQERFLESMTDSDDFCQEEDTETMIKDSLKRYPRDTTFTEYLANAEDCGSATKISWVVDMEGSYPSKDIIDPELAGLQGPALFCHNDGGRIHMNLRNFIWLMPR